MSTRRRPSPKKRTAARLSKQYHVPKNVSPPTSYEELAQWQASQLRSPYSPRVIGRPATGRWARINSALTVIPVATLLLFQFIGIVLNMLGSTHIMVRVGVTAAVVVLLVVGLQRGWRRRE